MRSFPYRPRAARRPPEAPEPETPEQSDRRFLFALLRIGIVTISAVPLAVLLVASGRMRSLAGLVLLVEVVLLVTVPRLRWLAIRAWLYWEQPLWWYVLEQDGSGNPCRANATRTTCIAETTCCERPTLSSTAWEARRGASPPKFKRNAAPTRG